MIDDKLTMRWSKRENDIMIGYPNKPDGALLFYVLSAKHYSPLDKTWDKLNFRQELEQRGYDLTTIKFSIKKKK